ncbi:MAG: hypothetical protein WKG07_26210 [Hymenobacter sp.]
MEKGIYIAGRGSYSIDQQRYNFQFGGQVFYDIKNGRNRGDARRRGLPVPTRRNSGTPARPVCDQPRLPALRLVLRRQGAAFAECRP